MSERVTVVFTAEADLTFGDELCLCGSIASLGTWDSANAVKMQWREGLWKVKVALPCGVQIELKLVIRRQGGLEWLGAGVSDNIVFQTSLGRKGGQGSHFVTLADALPCKLHAEDLPLDETSDGDCTKDATIGRIREGYAQAPQAPHILQDNQATLAALAARAGHTVTYTTTTSVTIGPPTTHGESVVVESVGESPQCNSKPTQAVSRNAMKADHVDTVNANAAVHKVGIAPIMWREPGAKDVQIRGSWDGWKRQLVLEPSPSGDFRLLLALPPGEYECKFVVDGTWTVSKDMELTSCENQNNRLITKGTALAPVPLNGLQLTNA